MNKQQSSEPIVYVLSINDEPLMPTKPAKARKLLKKGEAYVVKHKPFTIKLNKNSTNFKQ